MCCVAEQKHVLFDYCIELHIFQSVVPDTELIIVSSFASDISCCHGHDETVTHQQPVSLTAKIEILILSLLRIFLAICLPFQTLYDWC